MTTASRIGINRCYIALLAVLAAAGFLACSAGGSPTKPSGNEASDGYMDSATDDTKTPPDQDGATDASKDVEGTEDAKPLIDVNIDVPPQLEEPPCANSDLHGDLDDDGWSVAEGDCNDCTPLMNPGAYDFPGGIDEDCDGTPDNEPINCDDDLAMESTDPMDAARALGLCRVADPDAPKNKQTWGVLSAKYVYPDGSTTSKRPLYVGEECMGVGGHYKEPNPLSHGILSKFGKHVIPKEGKAMLALSTGAARPGPEDASPSAGKMCTASTAPEGFPTSSKEACPGQTIDPKKDIYDAIALEVKIRTPSNAKGFSYDFNFFTYEYPTFVCSSFNDFFVALMWPQRSEKALHYNISFDAKGNPVSVNNSFLEVCKPGTHQGKTFDCLLGTDELLGTGFEPGGATSWLRTSSPVNGAEDITLRFAIWDSNDEVKDATVLIDNIRWELEKLDPQTIRPPK